jgi:BMFP domain-containing protein YqiC
MPIKKFKPDELWAATVFMITTNHETLQEIRQNSRWFSQRFFRQMVLTYRASFGVFAQILSNTRAAEVMLIRALYWIF